MSKNGTPLWQEAQFEVKMHKTRQVRGAFSSSDVEKIARRCGEKHVPKSKCKKTDGLGALLEVSMSKNCTPLWREANFQVKMLKS